MAIERQISDVDRREAEQRDAELSTEVEKKRAMMTLEQMRVSNRPLTAPLTKH